MGFIRFFLLVMLLAVPSLAMPQSKEVLPECGDAVNDTIVECVVPADSVVAEGMLQVDVVADTGESVSVIVLLLQLALVFFCIIMGARKGGIGLGVFGGVGTLLLVVVFGLEPGELPVDVMLMIAAVISAVACMQAAGGLDLMVKVAEWILRRHPQYVTILAPLVTYIFTFLAGTGHVAYSVLPVIAEVARETKIRPERPLGIAVIASQQAIVASPISAAMTAMLAIFAADGVDITMFDILKITIPATLIGVIVGALCSMVVGKPLMADPVYLERLKSGEIDCAKVKTAKVESMYKAVVSVVIFLLATALIVLFGSMKSLRPSFGGEPLSMSLLIEMIMLTAAALMLLVTRTNGAKAAQGSVFSAGMQAVVAIFGIAWMGDTFISGNISTLQGAIEGVVYDMPWLFGIALFVMSILLYSQAATVKAIMPLGLALGLSPMLLIALFPAVNGYFFIPNYPTIVAAINFDSTGTTRIGKWVLNHSFMIPGLIATVVAIAVGMLLTMVW